MHSLAMAILNIFTGTSIQNFISLGGGSTDYSFIAAWFILSVATSILATGLISFRLVRAHRRLTKCLGAKQSKLYTGIIAILVESSLPFAISGVVASATVRSYFLFPGFANVWYAFAVRGTWHVDIGVLMECLTRPFPHNSSYIESSESMPGRETWSGGRLKYSFPDLLPSPLGQTRRRQRTPMRSQAIVKHRISGIRMIALLRYPGLNVTFRAHTEWTENGGLPRNNRIVKI